MIARHKWSSFLLLGIFGMLLVAVGTPRAEEKKADPDFKLLTPNKRGVEVKPATAVQFTTELGLSFQSLNGLGVRIDEARRAADPVGLAVAAHELAVAEKVADKKASLSAEAVMKEATKLAKMRDQSRELRAVALLSMDGKAKEELETLAAKAAKAEKDLEAARKSGERPKGLWGTLKVDNLTGAQWRILTNGNPRGIVPPYKDVKFQVQHGPNTNTVIEAVNLQTGQAFEWYIADNINFYSIELRNEY